MARIGEIFPSGDRLARFVVAMSIARNDLDYGIREAERAGRVDDPAFNYMTRLVAGHLHEALHTFGRWSQQSDVSTFLRSLNAGAQTALKQVRTAIQQIGPRALDHARNYTFHYPYPDPGRTPDPDVVLAAALAACAEEEARLLHDSEHGVWHFEFADKIALWMALQEHALGNDDELKRQLMAVRETAHAFRALAAAIIAEYFEQRGLVSTRPPDVA